MQNGYIQNQIAANALLRRRSVPSGVLSPEMLQQLMTGTLNGMAPPQTLPQQQQQQMPPPQPQTSQQQQTQSSAVTNKRNEVYRFTSTNPVYSIAMSNKEKIRICSGSLLLSKDNIQKNNLQIVDLNDETNKFELKDTLEHNFPATKILFCPDSSLSNELLCTTSDCLKLYNVDSEGRINFIGKLHSKLNSDYKGPYTSMDWNRIDPSLVGVSSSDTTCVIWQIETGQIVGTTNPIGYVHKQLIAHDKSVNDFAFGPYNVGRDTFVSAGSDASVRLFDVRDLKSSTILYEEPNKLPLVRVQWNPTDENYLATLASNSNRISIIDIRKPCTLMKKCDNASSNMNSMAWSQCSRWNICTAGGDKQALIWQLKDNSKDGISWRTYCAENEISNIYWGKKHSDWITITFENSFEILHV
uniref:WD_REPEATS_REGION domain-containing protein n=1 Tax=Parastrongyloides trichosuri TaxID=131310 RepID=A0A0N4ZLQ8_PARTI